jgi:hypothetical protein
MSDKIKPDTSRLMDWLEGKLPAEEATAMTQLVESTPDLQAEVGWLRDFLQLSRTTTLADPPPEVRRSALAAFDAYARTRRPPGRLRLLIAALTADNRQHLAPAGARNAGLRSEPRQLIYSSDAADIALNALMRPNSGKIDLYGQILLLDDGDPSAFIIQLLQDGVERRLTYADDLGKFSLDELPPGQYDLLISNGDTEIAIDALELD